ncbi:sialate O-acetylesterase [Candidatus Hydrogenedentota bacterium]
MIRRILALTLTICLMLVGTACQSTGVRQQDGAQRPIKVFILSGQSNMVGRGVPDELPEIYHKPDERILMLRDGEWRPFLPDKNFFGPEISFAREMAKAWPKDRIGIIKVGRGGTAIKYFFPECEEVFKHSYPRPLYQQIMLEVTQARAVSDIEICGFLWKHGGADMKSTDPNATEIYIQDFRKLMEALRQDTTTPDLPAFISTYYRLDEFEEARKEPRLQKPMRSRPALFDILRAQVLAQDRIPHVRTVVMGMLPLRYDGIHFNTEGQLIHGRKFAEAVVEYYIGIDRSP